MIQTALIVEPGGETLFPDVSRDFDGQGFVSRRRVLQVVELSRKATKIMNGGELPFATGDTDGVVGPVRGNDDNGTRPGQTGGQGPKGADRLVLRQEDVRRTVRHENRREGGVRLHCNLASSDIGMENVESSRNGWTAGSLSQLLVRPVAERPVRCSLAAAKIDRVGLLWGECNRFEPRALMRPVAEGLVLAPPASAPIVGLSFFDLGGVRGLLWDHGFVGHLVAPVGWMGRQAWFLWSR